MMRHVFLLIIGMFALASCGPTVTADPDGGPQVYRLNNASQGRVQIRMLDGVNALRRAQGLSELQLDSSLNAAAEAHSRDMSTQQRPWHFSSDGSSPVERVQRVGYTRTLLGQNISETYETELQTLAAWMQEQAERDAILDPQAADLGFAYYQESDGKIWYTMMIGGGGPALPISPSPPARTTPPPPVQVVPEEPPADTVS